MLRNKSILKEQLLLLPKTELVDMLLKLSGKRYNYEFLLVNFLDPEDGEQQLFEEAMAELDLIFDKSFKGRTPQHQRVKLVQASVKRIDEFTVETKSRKLEADLLLYVLRHEFLHASGLFGAKFSGFDFKIALLLKRLITIVTSKIHPDYVIDYAEEVDEMLQKLHTTSERIATVRSLPLCLVL